MEKVLQKKTAADTKNEPPVIEIKNVKKVYRMGSERICAVDDVSFEINKGEFCCLLGTSGSGKSTLLNLMAGIEKASGGQILIKGKDVRKMSEKQLAKFRQRYLGFVFQSYNLLNSMTALENVEFPLVFKRVPARKRRKLAKEMLIKVGLGGRINHRPKQMSGGQQQRVGIARAFVAKPEIVFADEPTGNLDTRTTMEVMKLIKQIARDNRQTIVMVTHDPRLADFADKIIRILDGKIQSVDLVEHPIDVFADTAEQTAAAKEENSEEAQKTKENLSDTTASEEKTAKDKEKPDTILEVENAVSAVLENSGKTETQDGQNVQNQKKGQSKTKERKQENAPAQENKKKEAGQK